MEDLDLSKCCKCRRLRVGRRWTEQPAGPRVRLNSICPSCFEQDMANMEASLRESESTSHDEARQKSYE